MSITKEEVKKLADLSRMQVSEEDAEVLAKGMDSILSYVSDVEKLALDAGVETLRLKNVFRDDVVTNNSGEYTESLLSNAPQRDGNYLKVKKIL